MRNLNASIHDPYHLELCCTLRGGGGLAAASPPICLVCLKRKYGSSAIFITGFIQTLQLYLKY